MRGYNIFQIIVSIIIVEVKSWRVRRREYTISRGDGKYVGVDARALVCVTMRRDIHFIKFLDKLFIAQNPIEIIAYFQFSCG